MPLSEIYAGRGKQTEPFGLGVVCFADPVLINNILVKEVPIV